MTKVAGGLDLHSDLMPSWARMAEGEGLVVERRRTAAAARRAENESMKGVDASARRVDIHAVV